MSDDYSVGARPVTREPYRGRYRVNRQTGERQVWNGSQYVPETAGSLAPDAQEALSRERSELDRDNLSVRIGNQFLERNTTQPTGSILRRIPVLNEIGLAASPGLQELENLQNRYVRSQIREGTSGAGNTGPEQTRIERSGPSITNTGPANRAIVLRAMVDRDLRSERITAMEAWVRDPNNRSLEGFEQWWTQNERRIRSAIQSRYEQTNGPINNQTDAFGRQHQNPPSRPQNVPESAQWDPDRRRWVAP